MRTLRRIAPGLQAVALAAMAGAVGTGCNALTGVDDLTVALALDSGDGGGTPEGGAVPWGNASTPDADPEPWPEEDSSVTPDAGEEADAEAPVDASDIDAQVEPQTKRVFVTSTGWTGKLGGLDGADQHCNSLASQAGLGGSWVAWLSTPTVNAIDRLQHRGAYVLLDGTVVVTSKAQLTSGSIQHAIDVNEEAVRLTANRGVWTGTHPDGTADATCNGWTSSSSSVLGTLASAIAKDIGWTKGAPQSGLADNWKCNTIVSLYCFEL